jgi:hypothetical protein
MAIHNISASRPGLYDRIDNEGWLNDLQRDEQEQRSQDASARHGPGDGSAGDASSGSSSPAPGFLAPATPTMVTPRAAMPPPPASVMALLGGWPAASHGISTSMAVTSPPRMALWTEPRAATPRQEPTEMPYRGRGPTVVAPRATAPSTTAPAPAQPRRNTGERPSATPPRYAGEPPVDTTWLDRRESELKAVRADYQAARTRALASLGVGPGWSEVFSSGATISADDALHQSAADDGAVTASSSDGRSFVFSDEAFSAHYQAQAGAPLQALAKSYGTDAATLLAQHPGLWTLATQDHALNAGPPPPGCAMGDAKQLGALDLYLADPQIAALIKAHGGTPAPASGNVALEQVRLFGAERFAQLSRLGNAMEAVRSQYSTALAQAQSAGSGPGWSQHTGTVTESGDFPGSSTTHQVTDSSFDPDAFTAWYLKQDGLANKAFASFYGHSHTTYSEGHNNVGGESGESNSRISVATLSFDNPGWALSGLGGAMGHTALHALNINDTPRLNDNNAVGFDLEAGWVTSPGNIHQSRDWFETAVEVAIVGIVSYVSAGTLGAEAAGALGMTTTTAAGTTALTASGLVVASAGRGRWGGVAGQRRDQRQPEVPGRLKGRTGRRVVGRLDEQLRAGRGLGGPGGHAGAAHHRAGQHPGSLGRQLQGRRDRRLRLRAGRTRQHEHAGRHRQGRGRQDDDRGRGPRRARRRAHRRLGDSRAGQSK